MKSISIIAPLALLMGCASGGDSPDPGQMLISWAGGSAGRERLIATATFCPADSMIEIIGDSGETAFGFAWKLAADQPSSGTWDISAPAVVGERGGAGPTLTAAMRLIRDDAMVVRAWVSTSGEMEVLSTADSALTGRFSARLRALYGADTVVVNGAFRSLQLEAAPLPCGSSGFLPPGMG